MDTHDPHRDQPHACPYPECTSAHTYGATTALKNHLMSAHKVSKEDAPKYYPAQTKAVWVPQGCFVDGCKSLTEFKERYNLTKHLKQSHKMGAEEAKAAIEENCESTTPAAAPAQPYTSSKKRAQSSLNGVAAPTKKAKK